MDDPVSMAQQVVQKLVQWRRLLASAVVAMIATCLFAHALLGQNGWMSYRQKRAEYQKLQTQLQGMEAENRRLDGEIRALKSDPKAIEKEAREQLRYAKQGEVIYLLPEEPGHPSQQAAPRTESAQK
ncbi:MAG: septum formation initiator family protein [Candidatus Korobacteraceae bacterium]